MGTLAVVCIRTFQKGIDQTCEARGESTVADLCIKSYVIHNITGISITKERCAFLKRGQWSLGGEEWTGYLWTYLRDVPVHAVEAIASSFRCLGWDPQNIHIYITESCTPYSLEILADGGIGPQSAGNQRLNLRTTDPSASFDHSLPWAWIESRVVAQEP